MERLIATRLILAIPILFGVSLIVFLLIHTAPGGPETVFVDPRSAQTEDVARIRENLGLNRPLYVQYAAWLSGLARGEFGRSFVTGQPVQEIIRDKFFNTLLLTGTALALAVVFAIPVGTYVGYKPSSVLNQLVTVLVYIGSAVPLFYLGLVFIYVFAVRLGWLPVGGVYSVGSEASIADRIKHLIMPAVVLAFSATPNLLRQTRAGVLNTLTSNFIMVARGKGLRESTILVRHVLPNALYPVVTILGLIVPHIVAGSVVVETLFSWSGLGRAMVLAVGQRDYPTVIGLALVVSGAVVVGNLVADLLYLVLDPRQR
ncbi:MAG: ABC transporter permease [Anaerolineales bacterium]